MKYYVDIDGVICTNTYGKYEEAFPIRENIKKINKLYEGGHTITLWTARGTTTKMNWRELTEKQMEAWGVKYHELKFGKPEYDALIDDRAVNIMEI